MREGKSQWHRKSPQDCTHSAYQIPSKHKTEIFQCIGLLGNNLKKVINNDDHHLIFSGEEATYLCSKRHEMQPVTTNDAWKTNMAKVRGRMNNLGPMK